MTARGTAGHGSLPRDDNPVEHLARAIYRLSQADQPVQLNATTRAYLNAIGKLPDYAWLAPLIAKLDDPATASRTADEIRKRDPGDPRHAADHGFGHDADRRHENQRDP